MWLYDEFNWPAEIANEQVTVREEFREKYLEICRVDVPAGERFHRQPKKLRRGKESALEEAVKINAGKDEIDNFFCFDRETMETLKTEDFQPEDLSDVLFDLSEHDFEICRNRDTVVYEVTAKTERYEEEGILDPDYLNPETTKNLSMSHMKPMQNNFRMLLEQ